MRQPLLGKPKKNMDKLDNLPSAYKITNVRTHLQAVVKYYNEKTGGYSEIRKVYLPMIALMQSQRPIGVNSLPDFQKNDKKHCVLKGYKPVVERTCLYYKQSSL